MKLFALNDNVLFYPEYCTNIDTGVVYGGNLNNLGKILRMLHLKYFSKGFEVWFSTEFKKSGESTDTVILFDSILTVPAANYLRDKYKDLRIIYWFWNHIYNPDILNRISEGIELWSYDKADCNRYNLKNNSQFYFKDLAFCNEISPKQDFFFIGTEKGRTKAIKECLDIIDASDLSKNFIVIGNSRKDRLKKYVPYDKAVKMMSESRCIVDLVPSVQKGLTLRPLEALFGKKKLITNFKDIVNYDFYTPNNIFIIGKDNPLYLKDFLKSPLDFIDDKIMDYYDFKNWIKRFEL